MKPSNRHFFSGLLESGKFPVRAARSTRHQMAGGCSLSVQEQRLPAPFLISRPSDRADRSDGTPKLFGWVWECEGLT